LLILRQSCCPRFDKCCLHFIMKQIVTVFLLSLLNQVGNICAITCYKCESYRDFRCLDPFDYKPHPLVNCDFEPFVRDRKPVFCEKTTDLIDGVYVTTRGCSTNFQWEDVDEFIDHRDQPLRCFRRGLLERCLCTHQGCNSAMTLTNKSQNGATFICLLLYFIFSWHWSNNT